VRRFASAWTWRQHLTRECGCEIFLLPSLYVHLLCYAFISTGFSFSALFAQEASADHSLPSCSLMGMSPARFTRNLHRFSRSAALTTLVAGHTFGLRSPSLRFQKQPHRIRLCEFNPLPHTSSFNPDILPRRAYMNVRCALSHTTHTHTHTHT